MGRPSMDIGVHALPIYDVQIEAAPMKICHISSGSTSTTSDSDSFDACNSSCYESFCEPGVDCEPDKEFLARFLMESHPDQVDLLESYARPSLQRASSEYSSTSSQLGEVDQWNQVGGHPPVSTVDTAGWNHSMQYGVEGDGYADRYGLGYEQEVENAESRRREKRRMLIRARQQEEERLRLQEEATRRAEFRRQEYKARRKEEVVRAQEEARIRKERRREQEESFMRQEQRRLQEEERMRQDRESLQEEARSLARSPRQDMTYYEQNDAAADGLEDEALNRVVEWEAPRTYYERNDTAAKAGLEDEALKRVEWETRRREQEDYARAEAIRSDRMRIERRLRFQAASERKS